MTKFAVIVFPNEAKAYEGVRALKELHAEGSLSLYGIAVIAKDAEGNFGIKQAADAGPLGTAVGALVGGLVGVLGGPAGALIGATGGTLVGSLSDLINYGVSADFVQKVAETMLEPGKAAVVAEISENWTTPLDARIESLGGAVLRTRRADFEDEQIAKEIAADEADLKQLQAEYSQASAEAKARIQAKLDKAKADLLAAQQKLGSKIDGFETEADARIAALSQQLSHAHADAKEKIDQRIAASRAAFEARSAKLKKAWALAKGAIVE